MNSIHYQALREAAQNYQSILAWYEAIPDSPHAEADCDRALAAFKRQIRHRETDIIADLLDELEAAKERIAELEEEKETLRPVGVMSRRAFWRPENRGPRFIALWPGPGIYLLFDEILGRINHHDVRDDIERRVYEIALASLEAEPVVYQYRLWDTEYDEWGEWEDCGECAFEGFVEEEKCLGAGVQTRKLYTVPQISAVPDGLVKAVRFYEQVKHENPPVETGAWKDAVDWVLKEACQVAGIEVVSAPVASGLRIKGENDAGIKD